MTRQRRYQARHRAAGLCEKCPRPVLPGYVQCQRHLYRGARRQPFKALAAQTLARQRFEAGEPVAALAARFKVTENAVRALLKRLGAWPRVAEIDPSGPPAPRRATIRPAPSAHPGPAARGPARARRPGR